MNEKLVRARKNVNLTQEKAATKIGVTLRVYQRYETDECVPNVKRAMKIAEVFHTTVEELFSMNDFNNNSEPDPHQIQNEEKTNI